MMEYLKNHILDEIDDALNYMEKAVEYKGTQYGCTFRMMSEAEAEHANALTKIFNTMEKPDELPAASYADMNKEILNKYSNSMGKLEAMKKLYWS